MARSGLTADGAITPDPIDGRQVAGAGPVDGGHHPAAATVVIVTYAALGLLAFRPGLGHVTTKTFSPLLDFSQSVWFLAWIPHALAHGHNPFFSHAIFLPTGVNLAVNTSSPLLGLLSAPLAFVTGPVAIANVVLLVGMPASATAAFVVLRRWSVWWPAAATGGLLYGFSPYMVGQAQGHVELLFVPLPPLIALCLTSLLTGRGSRIRQGLWLGVLVVAQYLVSPEVLATVGLLTLVALVCVAVRFRSRVVATARAVAVPTALGATVALVLLAYPLWMMLAGPQHVSTPQWSPGNPFHSDLLSFVAPGSLQAVHPVLGGVGVRLVALSNSVESGSYIGIPLLVVGGLLAWSSRRSPRMQLSLVLLAVAMVLSLGAHLAVNGRTTWFPLPYLGLTHVPLVEDILPARFSYEIGALVAAVLAFGLDDARRRTRRIHRHATGAHGSADKGASSSRWVWATLGIVVAVSVATWLPVWPYPAYTASVLPAVVKRALPVGDPVALTWPYDATHNPQPLMWQADADFGFRLIGGYAYHPGPGGLSIWSPAPIRPLLFQHFLDGAQGIDQLIGAPAPPVPITPQLLAATRVVLARYGVSVVLVDSSAEGAAEFASVMTRVLGAPELVDGALSLWRVRPQRA